MLSDPQYRCKSTTLDCISDFKAAEVMTEWSHNENSAHSGILWPVTRFSRDLLRGTGRPHELTRKKCACTNSKSVTISRAANRILASLKNFLLHR